MTPDEGASWPPEWSSFAAGGPARLSRVYGSWSGRVAPYLTLHALDPEASTEAFAITSSYSRTRAHIWHRIDAERGETLESYPLGTQTQHPTALSPDGQRVAFYDRGTLSLRTNRGAFLWKRRGGWTVAHFVPGEDRLLAANPSGFIAEIDASNGAVLTQHRGREVYAVARDGQGVLLRTLSGKSGWARWDRRKDTFEPLPVLPGTVHGALLIPGEDRVVLALLGPEGGSLCLLEKERLCWSVTLPLSTSKTALALDASEQAIRVLAGDETMRLLRLKDGVEFARFTLGSWTAASLSEDGKRALLFRGHTYSLWREDTGARRGANSGAEGAITAVALEPGGRRVIAASQNLHRWTRETPPRASDPLGNAGPFHSDTDIKFTPDGTLMLLSGRHQPKRAWRLPSEVPERFPYDLPPTTCAWKLSPDGLGLWIELEEAGGFGQRKLIRLTDGVSLWEHPGRGPVAFSGGAWVTTAWVMGAGTPLILRLTPHETGCMEERITLQATPEEVAFWGSYTTSALSPDGAWLVTARTNELRLFDARSGRLCAIEKDPASSVHFIGNKWLLLRQYQGSTLRLRRVPDLAQQAELSLQDRNDSPHTVWSSLDGEVLLVGTTQGVVLEYAMSSEETGPSAPEPALARAVREAMAKQQTEALDEFLRSTNLETLPVALLNELLIAPEHHLHQRVAFALQKLADPSTTPYAERALAAGFDRLAYTCSDDEVIAKWFSWLLACIDTPEALSLLHQYASSSNPQIAEEMTYRLSQLDQVRAWKRRCYPG